MKLKVADRSAAARACCALLLVFCAGLVFHGQGAFYRPELHLDFLGSKAVLVNIDPQKAYTRTDLFAMDFLEAYRAGELGEG